jgi:hypothetical protein
MEFLRDLRTLTIPWSTKAFAIGLLVLTVAANGALFAISLAQAKSDLVSSSLQFFGVLLPIILVVAVLSRADTGVKALKQRTEHLFLRVLPQALEAVGEHPAAFYAPNPRRRPPKAPGGGRVLTNLSRDECYGDISVFVPVGADRWTVVVLRLELNVRRVCSRRKPTAPATPPPFCTRAFATASPAPPPANPSASIGRRRNRRAAATSSLKTPSIAP